MPDAGISVDAILRKQSGTLAKKNTTMAEMTIRLQTDPHTGKKNILVSLKSDEDMLPHEHEQQHRALVEKLIEGGVLNAAQVGKLIVERESENIAGNSPCREEELEQGQSQSGGS
jgi:hypothetical protein